ncbi:MAG: hypothetical protein IKR11_00165, partial [Solobacterium sp.]|nr:hypothetical protein [Solobacterium sp.]
SQRPQGRKRNDSGKTTGVNKRGDGIGGGPSGNANYNRKPTSNTTRNITRGGGAGIIILLLAMLFGNGGLGNLLGGGGSDNTYQPTPTPVVSTPTPTQSTTSHSGYHFGTPASQQTTYVNASTETVDTSVSSGARDKYTVLKGNGKDVVTVMVYMCGTDLESNYGMATSDINEMINATQSSKVNVILETGGTKQWKNRVMSAGTNQRWKIAKGGIQPLEQNLGRKAMTEPSTLTDFIQYCAKNYPADRYMLIFWDHGGGSVTGYGYDQLYPNGSMSVDEIAAALKAGGVKFDIIGFDACLMANMETAIAVEPYGDYLLASEETEPGTGWYHTDYLNLLANNTSVSTLELGKKVIDDFCTKNQSGGTAGDKNTLSLIDLAEFKNTIPAALSSFSKKISSDVKNNKYQNVADARSSTKEFGQQNRLDQIDLVHFCNTLNTNESKALANAIKSCVKYNKTRNVNNAYGISIYFPYRNTKYVNPLMKIYDNIDFDSDYGDAIKTFATLEASGQIVTNNTSNSMFNMLTGGSASNGTYLDTNDILSLLMGGGQSSGGSSLNSLLGGGSVDNSAFDLISAFIGRNHIDSSNLVLTEKNGKQVLSLSDEEWTQIQDVKLNVWVDDGEGYIDLGLDDIYQFDDDGDLVVEYDGMWMALNDHVVSYYTTSSEYTDDNNYSYTGYIPAMINDEEVQILVEFSDENPEGIVLGAQNVYETGAVGKLAPIEDGSVIDFICDYYDYDGNFSNRFFLGDPMTVNGTLELSDIHLDVNRLIYGYCLTDIYGSDRWTPMLEQ